MLKSKKFEITSLLVKAIGNFIAEVGEVAKVSEDDHSKIQVYKEDLKDMAQELRSIELLLISESNRYPRNKQLNEIKTRVHNLREITVKVMNSAMIDRQ